jgi:hypothetical protein
MITSKLAARMLRVSVIRVRQLAQAGRIVGAQKLGRDWLIPDRFEIDPPLKVKHRRKRQRRR